MPDFGGQMRAPPDDTYNIEEKLLAPNILGECLSPLAIQLIDQRQGTESDVNVLFTKLCTHALTYNEWEIASTTREIAEKYKQFKDFFKLFGLEIN